MRVNYEAYVRELRASQLVVPDSEELLILHMARIFGETEASDSKHTSAMHKSAVIDFGCLSSFIRRTV